jgi:hypothetical protein
MASQNLGGFFDWVGDAVSTVKDVVTDPVGSIESAATWVAGAGIGGVAGAVIGGVAGTFVMNPALGAQLGFQMGVNIGGSVATVDPSDVQNAVKSGAIAVYDDAGNLIAGDPNNPNHVTFTTDPYNQVSSATNFIDRLFTYHQSIAQNAMHNLVILPDQPNVRSNLFLMTIPEPDDTVQAETPTSDTNMTVKVGLFLVGATIFALWASRGK